MLNKCQEHYVPFCPFCWMVARQQLGSCLSCACRSPVWILSDLPSPRSEVRRASLSFLPSGLRRNRVRKIKKRVCLNVKRLGMIQPKSMLFLHAQTCCWGKTRHKVHDGKQSQHVGWMKGLSNQPTCMATCCDD